ncbi:phosphoglycolate phosphatase [Halodesulfurarchaeum sp. HSR-GB]|uniref:phosphoglycolate phosphatase n=1 Tax=Halodesulfurarchaeum sp. HSR-GB TaxID=3074077 RepID=UPI002860A4A9|nr:phosphoglycolate phosphatase [Halodesulfurarchaeum sp. HSR-GB]MDR5657087.1 phosphoglycolate phosphatase [Halodesulfurarchaeum sp. HSR-GB]
MAPPLAVDIDGTLSRPDRSIDPRIIDALGSWPAPVIVATGKALPFPVALAQYSGLEPMVVAENGGIAVAEDTLQVHGDRAAADAVAEAYQRQGHDLGFGELDLANKWRETEIAVSRESPLEPLEAIAAEHGLEVVDSEYAYHVKSPDVSKGAAFEALAAHLEFDPGTALAVGDSPNDVSLFEVAGTGVAVANATPDAKEAADIVTSGSYADGFLEALNTVL